jgi:hypothetical protein
MGSEAGAVGSNGQAGEQKGEEMSHAVDGADDIARIALKLAREVQLKFLLTERYNIFSQCL